MNAKDLRQLVERVLPSMLEAMGLERTRIEPDIRGLDDGEAASIEAMPEYERAFLYIDPSKVSDERYALDTLRHELLHVLLSPYERYREFVAKVIDKDSPLHPVFETAWDHACEASVANLEIMLDSRLKVTPEKLVRIGEKRLGSS